MHVAERRKIGGYAMEIKRSGVIFVYVKVAVNEKNRSRIH